ncbi:hypothetical protein [Commensalibacter nepenthis]|uniref:Lipoprotein n=1 Tax=Commensalibacter nepenthis TaxID=3043872 RepID=A0ABT6Q9S7_9PROT|nr:hypothetical protein [Commensalibacter sp. TBRC 10068]MDI2113666.1 hypothetical protein [Commensalibacter sp. TBRC 10068]
MDSIITGLIMKRYISLCLVLSCLTVVTIQLSGCGRKGSPKPPGPADKVTYPRSYPPID